MIQAIVAPATPYSTPTTVNGASEPMFCEFNEGIIRENRRHGMEIFWRGFISAMSLLPTQGHCSPKRPERLHEKLLLGKDLLSPTQILHQ